MQNTVSIEFDLTPKFLAAGRQMETLCVSLTAIPKVIIVSSPLETKVYSKKYGSSASWIRPNTVESRLKTGFAGDRKADSGLAPHHHEPHFAA
jgi:hypothetical protein